MSEPTTATLYHCPACAWQGTSDAIGHLTHLRHIDERIAAGELVPAGSCPECRALIEVADADVPDTTLEIAARILRQRGWTVERNGVPKAMYLVRSQSVSGYAAAPLAGIALSTLYRSAAWKAYQAELDAKRVATAPNPGVAP
jgi:hypothetical protein